MCLLQSIVEELDRELTRLHALRTVVADLGRTPKFVARLISSSAIESQVSEAITGSTVASQRLKMQQKPKARAPRLGRERTPKPSIVREPSALAATIPSGPVLVNPARLVEEKAQREQSKEAMTATEPAKEALDALSRSLALRWTSAGAQQAH